MINKPELTSENIVDDIDDEVRERTRVLVADLACTGFFAGATGYFLAKGDAGGVAMMGTLGVASGKFAWNGLMQFRGAIERQAVEQYQAGE